MIKLYGYFRSSTSYRVRIALNLKQLDYESLPVHLIKDGGEHHKPEYKAINPQGSVPTLVHDDVVIGQSMAIMEYLDGVQPEPPLVFGNGAQKAFIRRLSQVMSCDIHPLANLRVLQYLQNELKVSDEQKAAWSTHWVEEGLRDYESLLEQTEWSGEFSFGNQVSMADLCLIPQLYNARKIGVDLAPYTLCRRIETNCMKMADFQNAAPESQPDAPEDLAPIHGPDAPFLKNAA